MMTTFRESVFVDCDLVCRNNSQTSLARPNGSHVVIRGFARVFVLALAFVFALTAAYGASSRANNARHASGAGVTVTISLTDYGAVGDGVTDDGPALQSALDALADAGGGNLFVPDGHYVIATPVSVDFSGRASSITIQGTPSALPDGLPGNLGRGLNLTAEFLIKAGEGQNAITLGNLATLLVEDLVFIGDPAVTDDAKIVLTVSGIDDATLRRCEFYGLASFVAGGAIVYAEGSGLQITDSAFLGCAGNSGVSTSIVQLYNWKQLSVTGTRFVDYGNRPGFYSKTPYMSPLAWVSVGGAAPLTNVSPRRDVIIKDVFFDEGAYDALAVRPDIFAVPGGGAISLVFLSNLYVNVTNLGEVGLWIQSADNVFIEDSHFGWSHNTRGAMQLSYVKNAILDQLECVASANTIIADPTVGELSVINSVYETLNSQAPVTRVITTTDPADGPGQYVNQKYLDILGHAPDLPGYVYWSQQRARCNDDAQCTTDEELLNYLNGNPATTFSINGRLVDTDGAAVASAMVSLGGTHAVGTLTDADGRYAFSGLATSGEYTVTPSKTFYTFNTTDGAPGTLSRSFITPGGNQTADFTGTLANYLIQGRVNDSNVEAMGGVNITLTGGPAGFQPQSRATNVAGDYSFVGLPAGYAYTLTPTESFYTFEPPAITLLLAGNIVNLDFSGTPRTHSIAGHVTDGAQPLSDASVTVSGDVHKITSTDANGDFRFDGLVVGGDYVVTVTKRHYTFASQTVNDLLSDWTGIFNGEIIRYSITGYVTVGANGLGGVSITLGGDQTATVVTTSAGGYAFTADAGGNYTITATKEGFSFVPPNAVFNDLDQNVSVNFAGAPVPALLTEGSENRAIAFNSITMLTEPFDLFTTPLDFGPDRRTRVVLFALHVPDDPAMITAQAEDALGNVYPLGVEFAGPLTDAAEVKQINLRLNSQLAPGADIRISISVGGITSNTVVIGINPAGN